jgi:hypothetical protein
MAISTPTEVAAVNSTSNATSYATSSFTPTTGSLLIIFVFPADADAVGSFTVTATHSGATLTERVADPQGWDTIATPLRSGAVWTMQGHSGSGTITASGFSDAQTGCSIRVIEVASGYDTSSPIVQAISNPKDPNADLENILTFSAAASSGNLFVAGCAKTGSVVLQGEGGSWTTLGTEGGMSSPNQRSWTQYDLTSPDTTSRFFWASTQSASLQMGVEVAEAPVATFAITARAYRFYADGTESGSTALANENTSYDADVTSADVNFQLRYGVQESGTGSAAGVSTDDYQLQYAVNGGGWNNVTGSSTVIRAFPSASLTDAGATTSRLSAGSGSFVAGELDEANGEITDWQLTANNYSDLLYSLTVRQADVADNDSITFRVLRNGAVFDTYSVTPTLTITKTPPATHSIVSKMRERTTPRRRSLQRMVI